jgi:hypothetical protein
VAAHQPVRLAGRHNQGITFGERPDFALLNARSARDVERDSREIMRDGLTTTAMCRADATIREDLSGIACLVVDPDPQCRAHIRKVSPTSTRDQRLASEAWVGTMEFCSPATVVHS